MTVKELIEKLSKFKDDLQVYYPSNDNPDYRIVEDVEAKTVYDPTPCGASVFGSKEEQAIEIS